MNNFETEYLNILNHISKKTHKVEDRTKTGTYSEIGGVQIRHHFRDGFPLLTTKRIYWKGVVGELLWFLKGRTDVAWLQERKIFFWDEWVKEDGTLGPIYGKQWRDFNGVDQIKYLIETATKDRYSRRLVMNAWNPKDLPEMALAPCHLLFQMFIRPDESGQDKLSGHFYQRSADMFLGVPFNIASYALLLSMFGHQLSIPLGTLTMTIGDAHVYSNHLEQIETQLQNKQLELPRLHISGNLNIEKVTINEEEIDLHMFSDKDVSPFFLENYRYAQSIKAPIAI